LLLKWESESPYKQKLYWLADMVLAVRVLWLTAHHNPQIHAIFTLVFALVFIACKLGVRFFDLRRVLES